uniref:Uncharacterized protein n=1 Tax=Rhizophora mucronata TaxID=61149 RepID=A0A2P2PAJ6_RHIMU
MHTFLIVNERRKFGYSSHCVVLAVNLAYNLLILLSHKSFLA